MSDSKEISGPSGSGTIDGYSVEARCNYHQAMVLGDRVIDNRWAQLHFPKGHPGVPIGPSYSLPFLDVVGLMSYPAAQAMRWWVHAEAERGLKYMCLETRIVKHRVSYSYSAKRESEHCIVGGDDRSNMMPDWGREAPSPDEAKAAAE